MQLTHPKCRNGDHLQPLQGVRVCVCAYIENGGSGQRSHHKRRARGGTQQSGCVGSALPRGALVRGLVSLPVLPVAHSSFSKHTRQSALGGAGFLLERSDASIKILPLAHYSAGLVELGLLGHRVVAQVDGLGLSLAAVGAPRFAPALAHVTAHCPSHTHRASHKAMLCMRGSTPRLVARAPHVAHTPSAHAQAACSAIVQQPCTRATLAARRRWALGAGRSWANPGRGLQDCTRSGVSGGMLAPRRWPGNGARKARGRGAGGQGEGEKEEAAQHLLGSRESCEYITRSWSPAPIWRNRCRSTT
jgi:hypothetical protein